MGISDWSSDVCSSDLVSTIITRAPSAGSISEAASLPRSAPLRPLLPPMSLASSCVFTALSHKGRSEERRVGKECVSTCRSGWLPKHKKKNQTNKRTQQHSSQKYHYK